MPSKKKKYNARFPAGRIKKIMQSDEEVGKVAQAVPVIISRTLELFVESLLKKTMRITNSRNAKTLSPSHMKQCIMAENRFDFLRELVKNIPDISVSEELDGTSLTSTQSIESPPQQEPYDLSKPSTSCRIVFPKLTTNGSSTLIGTRNGQQMTCANLINEKIPLPAHAASRQPTSTVTSSTTTTDSITTTTTTELPTSREALKRQWDSVNQIRQQILNTSGSLPPMDFYKDQQDFNDNQVTTDCSPTKLIRMESNPNLTDQSALGIKSIRQLQHQPKSVPCSSTTSKESINIPSSNVKSAMVPAPPIVSIDICNKPIVKIEYSNLNLHDIQETDSLAACSSSPSSSLATNDTSKLNKNVTAAAVTNLNPVINIDLSKIATQPPTIQYNVVDKTPRTQKFQPKSTNTVRSKSLDLDEDYDNI